MPEIKNTFTQGKMNKDLDERIIPNGQYRDALNIQVSTSDGEDVGTVQNILGNTDMDPSDTIFAVGDNYECVGSIADEKNDTLYSFIVDGGDTKSAIIEYKKNSTTGVIDIEPVLVDINNSVLNFSTGDIITGINIIDNLLFWTDGVNEPKKINIDSFKLNTHSDLSTHSKLYVDGDTTGVDVTEDHITVIKKKPLKTLSIKINKADPGNKNPLFKKIFPRFSYRYRYDDGEYSAFAPFTDVVFNSQYPTNQDGELHNSNTAYSEKEPYNAGMINMIDSIELSDFVSPNMPIDVVQIDLLYKQENSNVVYIMEVLKKDDPTLPAWDSTSGFDPSSTYKGKFTVRSENIYAATPGNQLLRPWDNVPKTALAQEVTGNRIVYGNYKQNHTDATFFPKITSDYTIRNLRENPFTTLASTEQNLVTNHNFLTTSDPWDLLASTDVTYNATTERIDFGANGVPAPYQSKMVYLNNGGWGEVGTKYKIAFDVENYQSGNINVRLTNGTEDVGDPGDYISSGTINLSSTSSGGTYHYEDVLTMLAGGNDPNHYNGKLWIESGGVKELDAFEAASIVQMPSANTGNPISVGWPGGYDAVSGLHPHLGPNANGYSLAIGYELFKVERPNGNIRWEGNVLVTDVNQHNASVSNQATFTLANSIALNDTGGTLGTDLGIGDVFYFNYIPSDPFEGSIDNVEIMQISSNTDNVVVYGEGGLPSVKSQRNYQLGVVYGDEFGRETPVFTSAESSIVIPFENATQNFPLASYPLQLNATINSDHPTWADYYKFYVKETSGEYYNLVMDALYTPTLEDLDSEDHVWLSFASSDRNKISKDDYIIFKRVIGSDKQISEDNKFRVLDVQNEAPDAIKYKYTNMGEVANTASGSGGVLNHNTTGLFQNEAYLPIYDNAKNNTIEIDQSTWTGKGGAKLIQGTEDDDFQLDKGDLYFSFSKEIDTFNHQNSEKYRISSVENIGGKYRMKLNKAVTLDDTTLILTPDDPAQTTNYGADFHKDITVKIEKKVLKDLEAFSGRFFVKILASGLINNELKFVETSGIIINHTVTASRNVYWQADVNNLINNNPLSGTTYTGGLLNNSYPGTYPVTSTDTTASVSTMDTDTTQSRTGWSNILTEMEDTGNTNFFIDTMFVSSVQHSEYAKDSGYGFAGGNISTVNDISYHCDVSQIPASGVNSWTNPNTSQSVSWKSGGYGNISRFGSTFNSTYSVYENDWINYTDGVPDALPNTKIINGLEGMIITGEKHIGGDAIRRWRTSMYNADVENTYGSEVGKFFLHISFLGPGKDLHDNSWSSNFNSQGDINKIHEELQGIHGGGVFTSYGPSLYTLSSAYTSVATNPDVVFMEKLTNSGTTGVKNISSINASGSSCIIPVSGYNTNYQELHDRQWDPTFTPAGDSGGHIADFIANLEQGKKFRFQGDTTNKTYTIKSVKTKKVYNHSNWRWIKETSPVYVDGLWLRHTARNVEFQVMDYGGDVDANGQNGDSGKLFSMKNRIWGFGQRNNRRLVYILELDENPTDSLSFNPTDGVVMNAIDYDKIEFLGDDSYLTSGEVVTNPAIWETESKDNVDLDIYYEASQAYPIKIDANNNELFAQIGCRVEFPDLDQAKQGNINIFQDVTLTSFNGLEFTVAPGFNRLEDDESTVINYNDEKVRFFREDGSYTTMKLDSDMNASVTPTGIYRTIFKFVDQATPTLNMETGLSWYNCFSFLNGVESNRIRDDFNAMTITNGVRASATLDRPYVEEHRKSGMIYSGIYNSTSGVNNLNQFIMAEKITKDLNPTYGSIQKLFSRRISLIAFCEDRVVGITANKNALYNADGKPQLVATNMVLGDANPFVGDYGISKNPESFAKESYRAYFTDKQRGAVLRLSMDGLTPISDAGMSKWFKDEFKNPDYNFIGSYDNYKNDYNLTIDTADKTWPGSKTITYSEDVKGWVSFKSFIQESGVSMAGDYYTFYNGKCWKHDNASRNTFYGGSIEPSTIKFVFNESPTAIKNFNTLNYDGDPNWSCDSIETNQQSGTITQFIEKEGKWFNYIKGDASVTTLDTSEFNFQGIGTGIDITYNY